MNQKLANLMRSFGENFVRFMFRVLHWEEDAKKEHLLIQIFNFTVAGVIATLIDFIFLCFFKEVCHMHVILANTLSFTISVLYNYWASMTFVFDVNKKNDSKRNFILFILFSIVGLILNNIIMYILVDFMTIHYLLSKVLATAVIMVFNYFTRKGFLE